MPEPRPWSLREQITVGIAQCEIAEAAYRERDFDAAATAQRIAEDAYRSVEVEIEKTAMADELRTELDRLRLALIKLTRLQGQ